MPIKESAKKALRQSKKRRDRNTKRKKKLRTILKKVRELISEGKVKEAEEMMPQVQKRVDKSVKVNLIKENKGDRIKSRLEKAIQKAKSQ